MYKRQHVLCEKPFTINDKQAPELYRLARDRHLFIMEGPVSYTHLDVYKRQGDNSNGWSFVNGQVLCGAEPADYSAVDTAMAAIPTDLTVYTEMCIRDRFTGVFTY